MSGILICTFAGAQNPLILGMLRGAGGGIIPYSLLYVYVARKPLERLWAAYVIGLANILAIAIDLTSVYLKEYLLSHAMFDVPIEALSLIAILMFQWRSRRRSEKDRSEGARSKIDGV